MRVVTARALSVSLSLSLSLFVQPRALAVRVQAVIASRQSFVSDSGDAHVRAVL
jgi:hypothetical protein